jgi:hypothetical protein
VIFAVDVQKMSATDLLTATTLEGIYNAQNRPSRLYLIQSADDQTWLDQVPKNIDIQTLAPPGNGSVLQMLLRRFKSFVHGAIMTNGTNADATNLATTMGGLDQAIVISPSQQGLADSLKIKVLYSFNTAQFTAYNAVQTYQWGIDNLLPRSSKKILVMLPGNDPNHIRDYAAATGAFMFYLTSTDATQKAVMNTIIAHTPANTPIMGYIPDEGPDVADLSSLGHFLNASDFLDNESVWAAMPSPAALKESTEPAPLKAQPNTVYVAFMVSDGDNAQYMQHRMAALWQDPNLGAIPEGWTVAPGTVDFAPTLLSYYNNHLPSNSELVAGPSGIGYSTQMGGSDLANFAQLTAGALQRTDIKTVDDWESLGNLRTYAQSAKVPSISVNAPLAEEQIGDTTVMGQTSGYIASAQQEFCTLVQQSASDQKNQPLFLAPLVDGWNLDPTDILHIAQQLATAGKASGLHYVFTTPTELALTMRKYYAGQEDGLPTANAQSVTGAQALQKPIIDPPYEANPVTVTGSNLVDNPSGASGTDGWTTAGPDRSGNATLTATTYQGGPALHWADTTTTLPDWIHYYPSVQNGHTYTFSVDLAGSGQAYLNVWTGNADLQTIPVNLTSAYQTLTWTVTVPSDAPTSPDAQAPQIQIRESAIAPVSVYIRNASVAESTPRC